jgi:hypothetical protein
MVFISDPWGGNLIYDQKNPSPIKVSELIFDKREDQKVSFSWSNFLKLLPLSISRYRSTPFLSVKLPETLVLKLDFLKKYSNSPNRNWMGACPI